MGIPATAPRIEVDGRPATADDIWPALLGAYGHFTAMQVRDRAVRGLDFHLARLDAAGRELFGTGLDGGRVVALIRQALADDVTDASVRVNVFAPVSDPGRGPGPGPRIVVSVRPPAPEPGTAQSLKSFAYQRPVAHIKHFGGFGQRHYRGLAQRDGYDEALLVDAEGTVAEGAITNTGFLEGTTVVWPDAPALDGVAMLVLRRELDRAGLPWLRRPVRLDGLAGYSGAFVTNSRGIAPVHRIDEVAYPVPPDTGPLTRLIELFEAAPWDPL